MAGRAASAKRSSLVLVRPAVAAVLLPCALFVVSACRPRPAVARGRGRQFVRGRFGARVQCWKGSSDICTTHANGINPQAGRNTNRTSTTWTPTTGPAITTRSCYNTADQLVATINGTTPTSAYTYDTRGNQTLDRADTYTWDSADRLRTIATAGTTITYTRDALDRLTRRTQNSTITGYTYNGYGDSPAGVLSASNTLIQQFHTLPGGVLVTINQTGLTKTWSYPDLNGNYTVTTDNTGTPTTTRIQYGPWGERLASSTGILDNTTGNLDHGAFGQHGKLEEDTTQRTIITMGARPYSPRDGRFLTVDPIAGGCANAYVYVFGDPVNGSDYGGRYSCDGFVHKTAYGTVRGSIDARGVFNWEYRAGYERGFGWDPTSPASSPRFGSMVGAFFVVTADDRTISSGFSDGVPRASGDKREIGGSVAFTLGGPKPSSIAISLLVSYVDPIFGSFQAQEISVSCSL